MKLQEKIAIPLMLIIGVANVMIVTVIINKYIMWNLNWLTIRLISVFLVLSWVARKLYKYYPHD